MLFEMLEDGRRQITQFIDQRGKFARGGHNVLSVTCVERGDQAFLRGLDRKDRHVPRQPSL